MNDNKIIFKPCLMEYEQYDKPVKYTSNFLKEIAEKYNKCKLVGENHYSDKIGEVESIKYSEDNGLIGIINTEKDIKGKSYSPLFKLDLQDKGDYFIAVSGELKEIALTNNPRLPLNNDYFLNNKNSEDDKMGESNKNVEEILSKQVQDLNKKNAMLENQLKVVKEKAGEYDSLVEEVAELKKLNEKQKAQIDEATPIVKKYNEQLEKSKNDLLEKISQGNEEVKNNFKDMSLDDLKAMDELLEGRYAVSDKPSKGIDSAKSVGLNIPSSDEDVGFDPNESLKESAKIFQEMRGVRNPYATE